jgi:hypothetical protein
MLAREAAASAQDVRRRGKRPILDPLCIYDLAADLGVDVWFQKIASLEGMYARLAPPRIILGAERPPGRRAYTCAHELGHHVMGHGSKIDELRGDGEEVADFEPEEYQAQVFAGMLLMPKLAVASAFKERGWKPNAASADEVFRIANLFGVGFETIVRHMQLGLGILPRERADVLRCTRPKDIRIGLVGLEQAAHPLVVVDSFWRGRPVDLEVGDRVLAPSSVACEGDNLRCLSISDAESFWEAVFPGRCRLWLTNGAWAAFVRIARRDFEGRSQFRHQPEPPADD